MTVAKITFLVGIGAFASGVLGLGGTWAMAVGSVTFLIAAVVGAVALEERDAVEGLVVHDLGPAPVEPAAPTPVASLPEAA